MSDRVYLDHNATTPLLPEVAERMSRVLHEVYGNPSSTHAEGAVARRLVDTAREQIAALLSVNPREIYFTAGATEANNTALIGTVEEARAGSQTAQHVVATAVEHPSIEAPLVWLDAQGHRVTRLPVDEAGLIDLATLDAVLAEGPRLVTIIWANNETGVIQPMAEIADRVKACGALLHVDATQAVGKADVDLSRVPADLLSLSAHKFNGPKGVGCLVVKTGVECAPRSLGGPQERRFRGGTENVAGIAGLGLAAQLASADLEDRMQKYAALRDHLWEALTANVPKLRRNGDVTAMLCNTLSVEFCGVAGDVLVQSLDLEGVAASAGAACHSGSIHPSHVLTAMGRSAEEALGCLRLSVGFGVDEAQIDRAAAIIAEQVAKLRELDTNR
ncbi:MAG: cysteine desulfurase family protein [Myxococcota bacterium]|nr:cysteine desulfurase family protein [Myxococcota bacterium]